MRALFVLLLSVSTLAQTTRPAPPIVACRTTRIEPGVYDGILLKPQSSGTRDRPTIIEGEPGVVIRPQPPLLCGVYSPDDQPAYSVIVRGITVEGAQVDGIRFYGGVAITIENCVVRNAKENGIGLFESRDCRVRNCLLLGNGRDKVGQAHGIYASGYGLVVEHNTICDNYGYGIHLWLRNDAAALDVSPVPKVRDIACAVVRNNYCGWNKNGAGIVIQRFGDATGACVIEANTVSCNGRGIQLYGGCGDSLLKNRCERNTGGSIQIHWRSPGPVYLQDNYLDQPLDDEMRVATRPAGGE